MNSCLFGLNLSILSFDLPINLIKETDNVIVTIITLPKESIQEFTIPARKMKNPYLNYNFNVKIAANNLPKEILSVETESISIIFRKKCFFHSDQVIAFTKIQSMQFPRNIFEQIQLRKIDIFKIINNDKSFCNNDILNLNFDEISNFKVTGQMNINISLTKPFQLNEFDNQKLDDLNDNSFNGKSILGPKSFRFKKFSKL